jgi:hypothetical protein
LSHETWRTVIGGGIIYDGTAVGIIEEIFYREMFDPYGSVGKAEFVIRRERKAAAVELAVAITIIGKRISKYYNLSLVK